MPTLETRLFKIILFVFLLAICAFVRLIFVQIIHNDYYKEKTEKQHKKKSNRKQTEFDVTPKNVQFDLEVNLKELFDQNKKIIQTESMLQLCHLLRKEKKYKNIDVDSILVLCMNKYNDVCANIRTSMQKLHGSIKNKVKILRKEQEKRFDRFYPLMRNIPKHIALKIEVKRYQFIVEDDHLAKKNNLVGFSVRRRLEFVEK